MSKISEVAIRRPVFAWMLMMALIVFGYICFRGMGVSQLPDVDFPVVNISLSLEGAAPEVMEMDVVDAVESAAMSIEGVNSISSTSKEGTANVTLEFDLNKNINVAVQEVQTKLAQVQRNLPKDLDPPIVTKTNPEDQPIMWISVLSKTMTPPELMAYVRDQVKDQFTTVDGVADVFLAGYVDPNLRVWVNNKKLNQYRLTVGDVISTIAAEHSEPPAGRIENATKEYNVRTLGEAETVEDFSKLVINRRGGAPNFNAIQLGQVAQVEYGTADIRRRARVLGYPAVGLGILKQRGSNSVEVAKAVRKRMEQVSTRLTSGTEIGVNFDSTRFIEDSINELNFTLILSAFLTALVCWIFLGSWSATINVIMSIPTSIIGSFMVLKALGFTLNTFTLLGLSLSIGIVVDDAIMVLENIVRHREHGKSRMESALIGSREIAFAAMAATAAIIAIFLPVAFMKGIIGKYFFQFGVTISVAVALSLLEALTLTPMRCSQFLDISPRTSWLGRTVEGAFSAAARAYARILPWLLRHRALVIGLAIAFCATSFVLLPMLRKEFVPPQDQASLLVRLRAPEGSSINYTDEKLKAVENILKGHKEIIRYFGSVGGFGGGEVNIAMMFITLAPRKQRSMNQMAFADVLRKEFSSLKGVKIFIQDPSLSGFSAKRGFPVEFSIQGSDWKQLIDLSRTMSEEMEKTGLLRDIDSDYRGDTEEVQVIPDRDKAKAHGVSIADIGEVIRAQLGGVIAGKFSKGGHRYDIRVKLSEEEQRVQNGDLGSFMVRNNRGETVPLTQLVQIKRAPGLQAIARQDRYRSISLFANLAPNVSQQKAMDAVQAIGKKILPDGYRISTGGSAKTFQESFDSLIMALILGLLVSYMVLASQFNSFIHPVTVLVALPFSVSGAFLTLLVTGNSLNIFSMIGLILLMGIVKKNSILLVDFTNQMREEGKGVREALIEACPLRLRPILMTSFATIVGAIPPALALGPGAETRAPMALAVIGGVLVSTLLTLFVVPCVYSGFARLERKSYEKEAHA